MTGGGGSSSGGSNDKWFVPAVVGRRIHGRLFRAVSRAIIYRADLPRPDPFDPISARMYVQRPMTSLSLQILNSCGRPAGYSITADNETLAVLFTLQAIFDVVF